MPLLQEISRGLFAVDAGVAETLFKGSLDPMAFDIVENVGKVGKSTDCCDF
jgi:hypothetical protein